jgi:uncharacterized protein
MRFRTGAAAMACALFLAAPAKANDALDWQPWSAGIFEKAKAEGRFVILDLEAVWCHWCHVMEETTYQDKKVVALLRSKYLTVRVDQDANPDLSNRYGDWGWPATIVFGPDGTEIVKRRGYIEPENMASLLAAIIADPTPGPSVGEDIQVIPSETAVLTEAQRQELLARSRAAYDDTSGGWGDVHKFIDAESMELEIAASEKGDANAARRAKQTFDSALNLLDREDGGLYQYSDAQDWTSPHYEKIMWYQASGLRHYALAYAHWKDPKYLQAASGVYRYLTTALSSPDGAFYTSQDADVDAKLPGKDYYALSAEARRKLGRQPRIDTKIYARENGWAISGLVAFANVTNDEIALMRAEAAARWIMSNRSLDGGGFRHGDTDRGGPYLGDTLAMGQATLDLYAATGRREWLTAAQRAGDWINSRFKDPAGGFLTTLAPEASLATFLKPSKPLDEQVMATRFANRLHRYFGSQTYRDLAEHGMRYLASAAILDMPRTLPGVLLADAELAREPTHMTIVGAKADPKAVDLFAAARAYPALNKRLDWWDRSEGPLPNPDVSYPELPEAAAFACTNKICSLPAFSGQDLTETVRRLLAPKTENTVN